MPGGAGLPSAFPSHVPLRTPGGSAKRATTAGLGRSVRSTWISVGNVSETTSSSKPTSPATGPVIQRSPTSTVGFGGRVSSEIRGNRVAARPPWRSEARTL